MSITPIAEPRLQTSLSKEKSIGEAVIDVEQAEAELAAKASSECKFPGLNMVKPSQNRDSLNKLPHSEEKSHSKAQSYIERYFVSEVSAWVKVEKERRVCRKKRKRATRAAGGGESSDQGGSDTDGSDNLCKLEDIMQRSTIVKLSQGSVATLERKAQAKKVCKPQLTTASSGNECIDHNLNIRYCDVVLDNPRTVPQSATTSTCDDESPSLEIPPCMGDLDGRVSFKFKIVRLTHTLRLKGWRRVPLERSNGINVERLSGALTNAVYIVTPPDIFPELSHAKEDPASKPLPGTLLLRIYGPQVGHLIDRAAELGILRRLAQKHIGPRLLGIFANGRFEEYVHALLIAPEEVRNVDTSRHIAKRLCELHDGIDLTPRECKSGPSVWLNWHKWLHRVDQVASWLDREIEFARDGSLLANSEAWRKRGYVCGVE